MTATITTRFCLNLINQIIKKSHCLGIWIRSEIVFQHFLHIHNYPCVTKKMFATKMHGLCIANYKVHKKRIYCSNEKTYITWYLFLNTDRNYSKIEIERLYTTHSCHNFNISDRRLPDDGSSDRNYMENSFNTLSAKTQPTTINHNNTPPVTNQIIQPTTKWYSPEALKFFLPALYFQSKSKKRKLLVINQKKIILKHLQSQLQKLKLSWLKFDGWKDSISDGDADGLFTPKDIFMMRNKCKYLYVGVRMMIKHYDECTVVDCFQKALDEIYKFEGCNQAEYQVKLHPKTVLRWYNTFKDKNHFHNHRKLPNGKTILPTLFTSNPDLKDAFLSYCYENLSNLSAEMLQEYLFKVCLPALLKQRIAETNNADMTIRDVLKENHLQTLSVRTINVWLSKFGFKYSPRKKNYYNDKHESEANVAYRHEFIKRYFDYEIRTHRWVQLPLDYYEEMCREGKVFSGEGYEYVDENNKPFIEFHIDDHPSFCEYKDVHPFGGNLSIRKPAESKPLIIFGQDEAIYKQFSFRSKCWIGPSGETPLMPKTDGQGLMVSAFTSREFGFGYDLNETQLKIVNDYRRNKFYCDEKAATAKHGKIEKEDLKISPFKRYIQYGNMHEGYWSYEDMIIQVEDCVDCLKALHGDTYDYMFLFDHSNGHDRLSPDALSPTLIRKEFGGKQPFMRSSIIKDPSYLGPFQHNNILKVGDIQTMKFAEDDTGPFYMTEREREDRKYDKVIGIVKKKLTKIEMIEKLIQKGLNNPNGPRKKLQRMCSINSIPTTKEEEKIRKGWVNKQKGSLQVLFERGWINPQFYMDYTEKGKMDEYGNRDETKSLKKLIEKQPDFLQQETLLQIHCRKLGVSSDRSPVAHPEIAGEGIEFNWGHSKLIYRAKPLTEKRNKSQFHDLVKQVLSSDVLTLDVCRSNARRARQYMLAYMTLKAESESQQIKAEQPQTECKPPQAKIKQEVKVTHSLIEQCVGLFRRRRTHRNAIDFDREYLKKSILLKNVIDGMTTFPKKEKDS